MALLLLSVTAISIYVGFAPLATFVQKMAGIRTDTLNDRIMVDAMPSELKPLARSYNVLVFEQLIKLS